MTKKKTTKKKGQRSPAKTSSPQSDVESREPISPTSAHPADVIDQLQEMMKGAAMLKDVLPSSLESSGSETQAVKENDRHGGASEKAPEIEKESVGEDASQEQKSAEALAAEKVAEQERQRLFHLCNSLNLYQKGHILSFLAREVVLHDVNSNSVLPVTACDIAIEGVSIVIRLPKKQDDGST